MNTLLRKYRLLLAVAAGCLVLALQVSGASSAFAQGVASGGVTRSMVAADAVTPATTINCNAPPLHDSCDVAGNEAFGGSGSDSYHQTTVNFRVPSIVGGGVVGAEVSFWASLGGDLNYGGTEHLLAGITSYVTSGGQYNFAWYQYSGSSNGGARLHFDNGLNAGDMIDVKVQSNLEDSGYAQFDILNERTNEAHRQVIQGLASDGHTGGCFGSRDIVNGVLEPIPLFGDGTEWLNNCKISTNQATEPVGVWPTTWYHIVNTSGALLVGIGGIDSNGSFTLNWKQSA